MVLVFTNFLVKYHGGDYRKKPFHVDVKERNADDKVDRTLFLREREVKCAKKYSFIYLNQRYKLNDASYLLFSYLNLINREAFT